MYFFLILLFSKNVAVCTAVVCCRLDFDGARAGVFFQHLGVQRLFINAHTLRTVFKQKEFELRPKMTILVCLLILEYFFFFFFFFTKMSHGKRKDTIINIVVCGGQSKWFESNKTGKIGGNLRKIYHLPKTMAFERRILGRSKVVVEHFDASLETILDSRELVQ